MAKPKSELLKEAQHAGLAPDDAEADDYSAAQLEGLLGSDVPAAGWVPSANKPIVSGVDGHVVLSQEDIDARN